MLRLIDDQWERIREHFPEENIPAERPVALDNPTFAAGQFRHGQVENRLIQMPTAVAADHGAIRCHARLGGTLNFYYRKAA